MHRRRITPEIGRKMALDRWDRYHASAPEREPQMVRTTGLSWAVRDDVSGVVVWMPLKSCRDVARRVTVLLREYRPGFPI